MFTVRQGRTVRVSQSKPSYLAWVCGTVGGPLAARSEGGPGGVGTGCPWHIRASCQLLSSEPAWRITSSNLEHTCSEGPNRMAMKKRHAIDLKYLKSVGVTHESSAAGGTIKAKRLAAAFRDMKRQHNIPTSVSNKKLYAAAAVAKEALKDKLYSDYRWGAWCANKIYIHLSFDYYIEYIIFSDLVGLSVASGIHGSYMCDIACQCMWAFWAPRHPGKQSNHGNHPGPNIWPWHWC